MHKNIPIHVNTLLKITHGRETNVVHICTQKTEVKVYLKMSKRKSRVNEIISAPKKLL